MEEQNRPGASHAAEYIIFAVLILNCTSYIDDNQNVIPPGIVEET